MRSYEKLSRRYKYRMRQKYQEDPFAFLILWSLFFSAVFLIFAFRGFIATFFMHKIDVTDQPIANEETTNSVNETNESPATNENSTSNNTNNSANSNPDEE